jgi:RsiW-degrading membrane proteinase PrsW (M82 family)
VIHPVRDSFGRLPVWAFLWGAFGAGLPAILAMRFFLSRQLPLLSAESQVAAYAVVFAPAIEESLKFLAVAVLATRVADRARDWKAGMLLGGAAGLGFAMAENFVSLHGLSATLAASELGWKGLERLLLTTPMHAAAGMIAGGWVLSGGRAAGAALAGTIMGLTVAMTLHGAWNLASLLLRERAIVPGAIVLCGIFLTLVAAYSSACLRRRAE